MDKKNLQNPEVQDDMEMEELNLDQLDNAAGGRGLRNEEKTETHDIDANTISRI